MKRCCVLAAVAAVALSCGGDPRVEATASPPAPRPDGCEDAAPGADLQSIVDHAAEGARVCLSAGDYPGPLRITRDITLWGPRTAVVRSNGRGTTIAVGGRGARLLGFTVSGSGDRFDLLDAAIGVETATDVVIDGVRVEAATFGILVNQSKHVVLRRNEVVGVSRDTPLGMRGDAIRMWETHDSRIEDNHVSDSRDVVVWYSLHNVIARNVVERSRYGAHLMYTGDTTIDDNRFVGNEVGVFLMYSHEITLRRNWMVGSAGQAGMGIGSKESGNLTLADNRLIHNTIGVYLDTSPLQLADTNLFERNVFQICNTGVVFHASSTRNTFRGNAFRDNGAQVRVDGGGNALGVTWEHNLWDDYAGYDLDGDGTGDIPYAPQNLSIALTDRYPNLAFFHGSLTLSMIEVAGRVIPIFAPQTILVDPSPALTGPKAGDLNAS